MDALPFADGSLDGYRAERLYQHVPDPARALAEARRVLAPGGRIVLMDQDWDALLLDSDDLAATRSVLRAFCDGIVNGTIGRQYLRLLGDAGFAEVQVQADAFVATSFEEYSHFVKLLAQGAELRGVFTPASAAAWLAAQEERGRRGRFCLVMTHFLASGRR